MAAKYSDELKALVLAGWKAGGSLNGLAKAYNVPKPTIQRWVAAVERVTIPVSIPKKEPMEGFDLEAMAWRLVGGSFDALDAIHGLAKDPQWLRQQNAADVAVFFGVISDKLIRVLGAARERDEATGGGAVDVHGAPATG